MNVKSKAALIFLAVFGSGIAVGALSHASLMRVRVKDIMRMREAGLLVPWRRPIMDRVSLEQQDQLGEIFDKHGKRLASIHQRTRKEIDAEFAALKEEIDAVLTPEQRREFEKDLRRWPPIPPGRPRGGMFPGMRPGGWPGPGMAPSAPPDLRQPGDEGQPGEDRERPGPPPSKRDDKRPPADGSPPSRF